MTYYPDPDGETYRAGADDDETPLRKAERRWAQAAFDQAAGINRLLGEMLPYLKDALSAVEIGKPDFAADFLKIAIKQATAAFPVAPTYAD